MEFSTGFKGSIYLNKYLIVSGDPSGDLHAANLMREIKILQPKSQFLGIGGESMISEGLQSIALMSDVSVVGFWEVAKKYSYFKNLLNKCINILKNENITAFIPIDYPGFNIRLSKHAKELKIPVFYYIAPQLWAWGKKRAKNLKKVVDKLLVVFPFEVEYFSDYGIETVFVGHPLLDNPNFNSKIKSQKERNGRIAFFPGSRQQEIIKHLKLFKEILELNTKMNYNFNFTIAKSGNILEKYFSEFLNLPNVEISDNNYDVMQNSSAGIIKTGTSNLEAGLCGMPFAMYYKTSFITYNIAKNLVNLPYISIINILSKKFVVKEFVQREANPELILNNIKEIINNPDKYHSIQNEYKKIRQILGGEGASKRAASIICQS